MLQALNELNPKRRRRGGEKENAEGGAKVQTKVDRRKGAVRGRNWPTSPNFPSIVSCPGKVHVQENREICRQPTQSTLRSKGRKQAASECCSKIRGKSPAAFAALVWVWSSDSGPKLTLLTSLPPPAIPWTLFKRASARLSLTFVLQLHLLCAALQSGTLRNLNMSVARSTRSAAQSYSFGRYSMKVVQLILTAPAHVYPASDWLLAVDESELLSPRCTTPLLE